MTKHKSPKPQPCPELVWQCCECGRTFDHDPTGCSHGTLDEGRCPNTGGYFRADKVKGE